MTVLKLFTAVSAASVTAGCCLGLDRLGSCPLLSWALADQDVHSLQIMLEEFGKYPENRDQFFIDVYNAVLSSAMTGGPLKGVAFWQWYDDGQARYLRTCYMS